MALGALVAAAAIVLANASLVRSHNQGPSVKDKMPWYHSGDELHSLIQELSQACPGVDVQMSQRSQLNTNGAGDVALDVLKVKKSGASPQTKAVFVFGEHARELITGESALNFVQTLCGQTSESERAKRVLDDVEFTIVPNANPISRKLVEEGQYCKRTNEDGVDLNRNWSDEHRDASAVQGDEMNPGPSAFSEPETKLLKALIDEEKPDIYLSIHSGAYLLGTPLGYTPSTTNVKNQAQMQEVLKPISEKYCNGECPYGDLAQLIGYKSVGCDIDYVSEKLGVPFVYTWEIYVGSEIRTRYIEEAKERRSGGGMSAETMELFQASAQNFVDRKQLTLMEEGSNLRRVSAGSRSKSHIRSQSKMKTPEADEDPDNCMDQFNPQTQEETQAVAENWSGAYLLLCEQVVHKRKGGSSDTPSSIASGGASANAGDGAAATDAASPSTTMTPQSLFMADTQEYAAALGASPDAVAQVANNAQPATAAAAQSTESIFDKLSEAPANPPSPDFVAEAQRLEQKEAQDAKPGLEQLSSFLGHSNGEQGMQAQSTEQMKRYWNSA